nr:MAG TPA: tail assembly chaperone protein [Caudoviricetes sp.]
MNRETEKIIEVMGRKFKIGKFDAFTGSYILFQLFEKIVPMGLEAKIPTAEGKSLQQELPKNRMAMDKEEFVKLQRDCLSVISEILPAGPRPIFNENGSWGLNDIEHNTPLVILLTIHALAFNVGDFFAAGGLTELQSSLAGLFPVSSQI